MLGLSKQKYSYADMLDWEESVLTELIEGERIDRATPPTVHQEIVGSLLCQLVNSVQDKSIKIYPCIGVRLFESPKSRPEDVDTVVIPDIVAVRDSNKLDDAGVRGAPDLIVEILSPPYIEYDRIRKFKLYEKAGVPELWLVNPTMSQVEVFKLKNGHYCSAIVCAPGQLLTASCLKDFAVDLSLVFSINAAIK